jgi:plastocyanin
MKRKLSVWAFVIMSAMLMMACGGPAVSPASTSAPVTPGESGQAGSVTAMVTVRDFEFSPKVLTVKKGTMVIWTNQGQAKHTVTADAKNFDGQIMPGQTFTFTFDTAGTFAYYCTFHGGAGGKGMSGSIVVQ